MGTPPENLTKDLAERVLHQGEVRLAAQLQIALAADQRAVTSAAIWVAMGTAALAFAGDRLTNQPADLFLAIAAAGTGSSLLVASVLCITAARPTRFALAGAIPDNWWSDQVTDRPYEDCLWQESQNYSARIRDNRGVMRRNARLFKIGMYLACFSPAVGLVVLAAVYRYL